MSVLVTGGAGFIGSHVVDRLMEAGEDVVCIDNLDPFYDPEIKKRNIEHNLEKENFKFIETDIRDKEKMQDIFRGNDISKVIHLAARAGVRPSIKDPVGYVDVNIRGTINLLELSREYGVENFIFGSSSSVYGVNKKVPFSEEDRLEKQISPYATSKRSAELFCNTYNHLYNIPITCLRFFTVYGPRQRPEMATHKFTRLINQGKEIQMFGDGSSKRDYTYIGDAVEGIINALNRKFDFEIFNIGESKTVELRYLISVIERCLGRKAVIKKLPDQPGDVPITSADISKAQRLLGYNPQVPIEEGVKRFVSWYKGNKNEILISDIDKRERRD
ncbi:MAG: SDR family NAD(P)-dependent oxidoreductase [Candidatus Altiarchaeota archaeon]|nr:SDR family NAD(P)-dependent oxidoreductase [Candidatus Altiarchaeota archaeon]